MLAQTLEGRDTMAMLAPVTRWLLPLALALVVGPATAQLVSSSSPSPGPSVQAVMVMYKGDAPNDEPWIGILADGSGNARDVFAAGHGGMLFMTRDNVGYVVVGGDDRVGLQVDMFSVLATRGSAGRENRAMLERLARQQLAVEPGGTERVAGVEGRLYRLTLTGAGQPPHVFEMVISTDPRLAPAGREILRFYDQLRAPVAAVTGGTPPQPYLAMRDLLALGTPLRVGAHYRLHEITTRDVSASFFALPGPLLSRQQLLADLERSGMFADASDVPEQSWNEVDANLATDGDLNDIMMDADAAANAAAAAANAAMGADLENDVSAGNAAIPD
jgi:hypothetical protein